MRAIDSPRIKQGFVGISRRSAYSLCPDGPWAKKTLPLSP